MLLSLTLPPCASRTTAISAISAAVASNAARGRRLHVGRLCDCVIRIFFILRGALLLLHYLYECMPGDRRTRHLNVRLEIDGLVSLFQGGPTVAAARVRRIVSRDPDLDL